IQRSSNTESTIRTVNKLLERQWKAVVDQADKELIPDKVMLMAGGHPQRARVIWKKLRLRQEFPMNFSEALFPWRISLKPSGSSLSQTDLPFRPAYFLALKRDAGIYVPAVGELSPAPNYGASTEAQAELMNPPREGWPGESSFCLMLALK